MSDLQQTPIRVLCLFTLLDRGGAETMCMNLYRNIDREKVQFDFLVYYPQRGQYEDEIEELGGRVYRIPHLDPRNLHAHIKGARVFFENHPEYQIVHNHMGENGALICNEAKKAGVRTIIYHSHTDRAKILVNPFSREDRVKGILINKKAFKLRFLYPIAMNAATDYYACGINSAKVFGKKEKEAVIINNAIDIKKFSFNCEKRAAIRKKMECEDKLVIGNVARINDNKNQIFAINVMKELLKVFPKSEMWFVGDGNRRHELQNIVNNEGYGNKIKFLGVRTDVSDLMQAMDVYIFQSINEGLPVSCIEAQAAGLPCVFSDGFDKNTAITNNVKILSLDDSIGKWVDAILSYKDFNRVDTSDELKMAGYDIKETAKQMESFYLMRANT